MKRSISFLVFFLTSAWIGLASTSVESADRYGLDVVHSNVLFKVKHNNVSYVYGRFNAFDADIRWDQENPANGRVEFTIKTESVDTHNERRDQHLRSPDFFTVRQYPEITFTSNGIKKKNDDTYEVSGDVTLLGQTRPVTFIWRKTGSGPGPRGDFRMGGITTFTLNRSDFGMNFMMDRLSDEVELTISLQAVRQ